MVVSSYIFVLLYLMILEDLPHQIWPIDVMILFDGKDILTFIKRTIKHVLPLARYNLYVGKYENKKVSPLITDPRPSSSTT